MRAVWVVEWRHPEGTWWPLDSTPWRDLAWRSMRARRKKNPSDAFRTVKYVPAQGGSRGR